MLEVPFPQVASPNRQLQRTTLDPLRTTYLNKTRISQPQEQLPPPYYSREYKEQRRGMLRQEFDRIDRNRDGQINFQELYNYLHQRCDKADRELVKPIFDSLDFNGDGIISIEQFLDAYNQELLRYQNDVTRLSHVIRRKRQQISSIDEALKQERIQSESVFDRPTTITLNRSTFNLSKGSKALGSVRANIQQGQALPSGCYVVLECEEQQFKTEPSSILSWHTELSFQVLNNLNSVIRFLVFSEGEDTDNLHGLLQVPLKDLAGQQIKQGWMHLHNPSTGKILAARLYVKVQWIRSKSKLLMETKRQYEEELQHSRKLLNKIVIEFLKMGGVLDQSFQFDTQTGTYTGGGGGFLDAYIQRFGMFMNQQFKSVVAGWGAGKMTVVYIFMVATLLRSFVAVGGGLDVTLSCVLLLTQIQRNWTKYRYFMLICLVCCSFVMQLTWVILMGLKQNYQWRGILFAIQRDESTWLFRVIIGAIMLILKLFLLGLLSNGYQRCQR